MNEVQKRYVRCYLGTILNIGLGAINQGAQRRENEKNRDWQERMYNKYSSPQAQVSQRMAAGLNPYVGVENQSVGSASTSALPSIGPVNPQDIGRYALEVRGAKADIENTQADTNLKQEQARSAWFDNIIKQLDAENYQAIIDAELAVQREEAKKKGAEGDEARLRVKMLEEFVANGGNVYQDTHDEVFARIEKLASEVTLAESQQLVNEALVDLRKAETYESRQRAAKIANERLLLKVEKALMEQDYKHKDILNPLLEEYQSFANEIQMSEANIVKLNEYLKEAWNNPEWEWPKWRAIILDFIKNNVSIFGGRSSSETSYGGSNRNVVRGFGG